MNLQLYNKNCYGLSEIPTASVEALITDPPYGISFKNQYWDKSLPDPKIWEDSLRVLKAGGFGLVFSSIRLMHRLMVHLEDSGFLIKDVLMWAYLNGMPKSRDISLDIDKELGVESEIIGEYQYVQGYKTEKVQNYKVPQPKLKRQASSNKGLFYKGSGLSLKPAYEPIILVQKPIDKNLNVAQNILKNGSGVLNLEETRIPYENGEKKVGHNPHPNGRVSANIIRTEAFEDGYDKFFLVPKVRQHAEDFNNHPTVKPVELMEHLVKLLTFEGQKVLDPFMGSGSTGLAAINNKRAFIGYELDKNYFEIAQKRILGI